MRFCEIFDRDDNNEIRYAFEEHDPGTLLEWRHLYKVKVLFDKPHPIENYPADDTIYYDDFEFVNAIKNITETLNIISFNVILPDHNKCNVRYEYKFKYRDINLYYTQFVMAKYGNLAVIVVEYNNVFIYLRTYEEVEFVIEEFKKIEDNKIKKSNITI